MNKPIKAKNLPLFSIIDLDQLRRENHLEDAVLSDFSMGWDQKIYLLFKQTAESQDKITAKTPADYTVAELKMDWAGGRNSGHGGISAGASQISTSLPAGHW